MSREVGSERAHFGGQNGVICETSNGRERYSFWRCMHCDFQVGGRTFHNQKARIHLSGDKSLRNGLITTVCTGAPEEVKRQFAALEETKRHIK